MPLETTGRPVRQIVVDFGLDVNDYAALGRNIPQFKPTTCPVCDRAGTMLSHGFRGRLVRVSGRLNSLFVRRIKCLARHGCRVIFTVLPSFLPRRRRCLIPEIEPMLEARFIDGVSFDQLALRFPTVAPTTVRDIIGAFSMSAPAWLSELCRQFALGNPEMIIDRRTEAGGPQGLVAMAIHALDWFRKVRGRDPVEKTRWLEELWLWGSVRSLESLFSPNTRAGP